MMKLKARYKYFVSSVKKTILKLKEKAILYTKQSHTTTQIYNEVTDITVEETKVNHNISLNCIDVFSVINSSIQQITNTIAKWLYSVITVNKTIRVDFLIPIFDPVPKYNIQT